MQVLPPSARFPHTADVAATGLTLFKHLEQRPGVIVLVHGLTGKPVETWARFPELLFNDEKLGAKYDVALYGYPTAVARIPASGTYKADVRVKGIVFGDALQEMLINRHRYRHIVLLGHSMGGLLSQWAIIHLIQRHGPENFPIQALVFLATPRLGSRLADGLMSLLSHDMDMLKPFGEELTELDRAWSDAVEMVELPAENVGKRHPLPVRIVVGSQDIAVPALSAAVGVPSYMQLYVDRSHTSICKPSDAADEVFTYVRRELLLISNATSALTDLVDMMGPKAQGFESPKASVPRQLVRDAVQRRIHLKPTQIAAGVAGAATLSFLATAGLGPLISAAAGVTQMSALQSWLAGIGGNVLAGILQSWGMSEAGRLVEWLKTRKNEELQGLVEGNDAYLQRLSQQLDASLTANSGLTVEITHFLICTDSFGAALEAIAAQLDAQGGKLDDVGVKLDAFHEFTTQLQRNLARLERSNTAFYSFTLKQIERFENALFANLKTSMQQQLDAQSDSLKHHIGAEGDRMIQQIGARLDELSRRVDVPLQGRSSHVRTTGATARPAELSSFRQVQLEELRQRLGDLQEEYRAVAKQQSRSLSDVDRVRLGRQAEAIAHEAEQVENELITLS